ncbi:hypothetical protein FOL47_010431 [Perkinsus chesapeaki]|uniref:Rab-GAP TBC domain-containing protein n=1 Tax=Perkinsus chesapeaki TaxID=330153 RepID=A0A7J6L499_PERCH|nr:hypothetical protein FOL47_010431 [Perkinsus chesapeaki]
MSHNATVPHPRCCSTDILPTTTDLSFLTHYSSNPDTSLSPPPSTSPPPLTLNEEWFLAGSVASLITSYLPDPYTWQQLVCTSKSWAHRLITERDTAARRARWPMTVELRPRIWHSLLLDEDIMTRNAEEDSLVYYNSCWQQAAAPDADGGSPIAGQVWRDVIRTEPCASCVTCFHHRLWRVLMATSERLKSVGYCQGMNYVVSILLKVNYRKVGMVARKGSDDDDDDSDDKSDRLCVEDASHKWDESVNCPDCPIDEAEVMTFRSAVSLLVRYQMVRMFELSDRFRLSLWTFDRLLEAALPRVHRLLSTAFDGLGVPSSFYASSWFLTLFSSDLLDDEHASERILDIFLSKGWKAIYRIGLVLMDAGFQKDDIGRVDSNDCNDLLMIKLKCLPGIVISELGIDEVLKRSEGAYGWVSSRLLGMLENAAQVDGGARLVLSRLPSYQVPLSETSEDGTSLSDEVCRSRGRSLSVEGNTCTGWAIVASTLPEHQFKLDPDDEFKQNVLSCETSKRSSGRWSFRKRISTRKAKKLLGKLSRSRSGRSPGATYHSVHSEVVDGGEHEISSNGHSPGRMPDTARSTGIDADGSPSPHHHHGSGERKKKHSWKKNPFKRKSCNSHS